MTRSDILLALLAVANGRTYTPAQLQKGMFLITRNMQSLVTEGPNFNFVPYDYGPFDRRVYEEANNLQESGLSEVTPSGLGRWPFYAATDEGVQAGQAVLDRMTEDQRRYIGEVSDWVRSKSFSSLVRSIYEAYPEMRENSIFQD